jgi:adenylate kinase family enzyme
MREMKVLIIGHPGAGKTYLAERLSNELGIDKIDIDVLFDKHPSYLMSKRQYGKKLHKLLGNKKDWIIDGYHGNRMPEEFWEKANHVIYLNLPKSELKSNVVARRKIKKANKEFSHWQATRINNIKNFAQIIFEDKTLKADVQRIKLLMNNDARFVELKSRNQITNFKLN